MVKDWKYTDNPEAEVPRMFIDKEIGGKDADGTPNIQGNDFLKELMCLSDEMGKKTIEVWINSPGGIVTEGQSIYTAILESKANVNTICYGIAASIAGVFFQAGKKRIMMDHANLMYHPAYSPDGVVDKALVALNKSICIMVAKRTGKTEDDIWAIMNRGRLDDKGTWIGAKEALEMGFCDEIRNSDAKNNIEGENVHSIWTKANKVFNRVSEKPKPKTMKTVLAKLKLNEEASEAAAIIAIDAMNKSMEDLKSAYDKKMKECDDLKAKMDEMDKKAKAEAEDAKAKAEEEDKKAKAKKMEDDKNAAEVAITNAVKEGRIKNDVKIIETYKANYIANPEGTKAIIESLALNQISPKFVNEGAKIEDNEFEQSARMNGLKPGTAGWYNHIKAGQLAKADSLKK